MLANHQRSVYTHLVMIETNKLKSYLLTSLNAAWTEDPNLAVQLATRFQSLRLTNEVRRLLLLYPERVLSVPDALHILLGPSLPSDVNTQLKVFGCRRGSIELTESSTFYTGRLSTLLQQQPISYPTMGIIRSYFNTQCARWRVTL